LNVAKTQTRTTIDPEPSHRDDPLLTFKEVAVQIGVSESTVASWVNQIGRRKLRSVRMPSGRKKVRQSVVNEILKATGSNGESVEEYQEE
jgi:transposase-like protein